MSTLQGTDRKLSYVARAFNPAHADLARSGGVPARLANEAYVEALARIVYYWAYAAVDQRGRHGMWEMMTKPGMMFGLLPGRRGRRRLYRRRARAGRGAGA
jgi:hypothetical protein